MPSVPGKLVRDKIPEIMRRHGLNPIVRTLNESAFAEALREKLHEEVSEYTDSGSLLADVLEVIHELVKMHKTTMDDIERIRLHKERGAGRLFPAAVC